MKKLYIIKLEQWGHKHIPQEEYSDTFLDLLLYAGNELLDRTDSPTEQYINTLETKHLMYCKFVLINFFDKKYVNLDFRINLFLLTF